MRPVHQGDVLPGRVLTCIVCLGCPLRSKGDSSVFVLDAHTSECLHYEPIVGVPPTKHVRIPREILADHPEVEIRNDLIDCAIDVCSVEVRLRKPDPGVIQDRRFFHVANGWSRRAGAVVIPG